MIFSLFKVRKVKSQRYVSLRHSTIRMKFSTMFLHRHKNGTNWFISHRQKGWLLQKPNSKNRNSKISRKKSVLKMVEATFSSNRQKVMVWFTAWLKNLILVDKIIFIYKEIKPYNYNWWAGKSPKKEIPPSPIKIIKENN